MKGCRSLVACLLLGVVAAACTAGESEATTPSDSSTSTATAPSPSPDSTSPDGYDIDALLAKDPLVIFNAYPPKPEHIEYELPLGQRDFDELWQPGAPWQTALEHVDIYRLHAFQMRHFLNDEQLTALIDFLREHEIPLMLETEPLLPPDPSECGHSESFEAPWDLEMAVRLKELGGQIDVIAIEEPYHFAHLLDTPEACQYPVERIVEEVLLHVGNLRDLFGDIPVGSIEPIWDETRPGDMEIWLDTYEEMAGEPFAFLHLDPNWYRHDWIDVGLGIEEVADARGVPLGLLYNGGVETDNLTWMNFMMANAAEFEVARGGTPQHVSFQSWVDWPDHSLPEDDLTALTSGIVRYFGDRVEISLEAADDGVVVHAADPDGRPLEGVHLEASRLSEERSLGTQTIRSVVPRGFDEALVLVRANAENAIDGEASVTILDVSMTDGAGGPNLVPNGDFDDGIDQWGVYGTNPEGVRTATVGADRGLAISASPDRDIFIDGAIFPVTPESDFELAVTYEIDGSPDSVVVSVEFVGGPRSNVFLHHLPEDIGEYVTDADGFAYIPGEAIGADPVTITVSTEGTIGYWPATALIPVE